MASEGYNEGLFIDSVYSGDPNDSTDTLFNDAPVGTTFVNQSTGEGWVKISITAWDRAAHIVGTVTTTDATLTTVITFPLKDNTVYLASADIVGRRTNVADRSVYIRQAAVYREGGGGATIQGSVATPFTRESAGPHTVTMSALGNNLLVQVQGQVGHTINWRAHLSLRDAA